MRKSACQLILYVHHQDQGYNTQIEVKNIDDSWSDGLSSYNDSNLHKAHNVGIHHIPSGIDCILHGIQRGVLNGIRCILCVVHGVLHGICCILFHL